VFFTTKGNDDFSRGRRRKLASPCFFIRGRYYLYMKTIALLVVIVLAVGGWWWLSYGNLIKTPKEPVVDLGQRVPAFEDFAVEAAFEGKPAAVKLDTKPAAKEFRAALTQGAKTGPNFSDKYTWVSWGCGTQCQINAAVDAETGVIVEFGLLSRFGVEVRRESKLLVINPLVNLPRDLELEGITTDYYFMEAGRLRYLAKVALDGEILDCASLVTRAINSETGEERGFGRPCQVPDGWAIKSVEIPGL